MMASLKLVDHRLLELNSLNTGSIKDQLLREFCGARLKLKIDPNWTSPIDFDSFRTLKAKICFF